MRYLAVFKGRNGCLKCHRRMTEDKIPAEIVNTPRETGYGCGISIEVPEAYYGRADRLTVGADSFLGWWVISEMQGGAVCTKL